MRDYFFVMRLDAEELAAFNALAQANQTNRPGLIRRLLNLPCAPPRGRPSKRARKTRQAAVIGGKARSGAEVRT